MYLLFTYLDEFCHYLFYSSQNLFFLPETNVASKADTISLITD